MDSVGDVKKYLKDFKVKARDIITSENSKDWIIKNPEFGVSALCELAK
jgi:hypothetical protein